MRATPSFRSWKEEEEAHKQWQKEKQEHFVLEQVEKMFLGGRSGPLCHMILRC